MRCWEDGVAGLVLMAVLSISAEITFRNHEKLYAYPDLLVAGFAMTWLVGLVLAIGFILGKPEEAQA